VAAAALDRRAEAQGATPRPRKGAAPPPPGLETEIVRLRLRHTWTTTMSSSEHRDTLHVRFVRDTVTGIGEGAPIVRYHESAPEAQKAIEEARAVVLAGDPWRVETFLGEAFRHLEGQYAARAALDIALHDWSARSWGSRSTASSASTRERPAHHLLDRHRHPRGHSAEGARGRGLPGAESQGGSRHRRGHDRGRPQRDGKAPARRRQRGVEGQGDGDPQDRVARLEGCRAHRATDARALLEEAAWVRERSPIPVFADEACLRASAIPGLVGTCHGVNVKLDKAGGLREALRMVHTARACGLKVMLGCMISSSVSTTAAAHLSPLVDFADLDGHLLWRTTPGRGSQCGTGASSSPTAPGSACARERRPRPASC